MPENTVYVGRGSKWGNPFATRQDDDGNWLVYESDLMIERASSKEEARDLCAEIFSLAINPSAHKDSLPDYPLTADIERELAGKNLACWCPLDQPCHADVLLEIANKETP